MEKDIKTCNEGLLHSINHSSNLNMERNRNISSDSGCDMNPAIMSDDLTTSQMDHAVSNWALRLDRVVSQQIERTKEVTEWAKEALRNIGKLDDDGTTEKKKELLRRWKRQIEGVLELTLDLTECVNNDTKKAMTDVESNKVDSINGHPSDIEEKFNGTEDELNKNRKRAVDNKENVKGLLELNRKRRKCCSNLGNTRKEVQTAYSKIKQMINPCYKTKKDKWINTNIFNQTSDNHAKIFSCILEAEEIFNDWNWNLKSYDIIDTFFEEWRWNLETGNDIRNIYYDKADLSAEWNNFNFWKQEMNVPGDEKTLISPMFEDTMTGWSQWEREILVHSMNDLSNGESKIFTDREGLELTHGNFEDVAIERENSCKSDLRHFWDENSLNQNICRSLMQQKSEKELTSLEASTDQDDSSITLSVSDVKEKEHTKSTHEQTKIPDINDAQHFNGGLDTSREKQTRNSMGKYNLTNKQENSKAMNNMLSNNQVETCPNLKDVNISNNMKKMYDSKGETEKKYLKYNSYNFDKCYPSNTWETYKSMYTLISIDDKSEGFGNLSEDLIDCTDNKHEFASNNTAAVPSLVLVASNILEKRQERKDDELNNHWEEWGLWNHFGTTEEIFQIYEEVFPELSRQKAEEKTDNEIQVSNTNEKADLEEEFSLSDETIKMNEYWSPKCKSEETHQKKHLRRERKEGKSQSHQPPTPCADKKIPKRPGTPTITRQTLKSDRSYDLEGSSWIVTQKVSKKEQNVRQTTRNYNRLHSKINAKQPMRSK